MFGGTFDPVHVGHLAIAEAARRRERLDEILFVPARQSPLKESEPAAAPDDRYEMVRRALAHARGMSASRLEIDREPPSYTVDTLRALARGGDDLFLIVGADAFAQLKEWRVPEEIRRLATILVARRPGGPDIELDSGARLLEAPLVDLSSRDLRAYARAGGSLRYLVPEDAWRYAVERELYAQREDG